MKPARQILLISDDPGLLHSRAKILELSGHAVIGVQCPEEGLLRAALRSVDLVVIDNPLSDLPEPIEKLFRESNPGIPILLVAGYDSEFATRRVNGSPGEILNAVRELLA